MATTICSNGLITYFLVMRLNTTIVASHDSLIVILNTFSTLKLRNGLKKKPKCHLEQSFDLPSWLLVLHFAICDSISVLL